MTDFSAVKFFSRELMVSCRALIQLWSVPASLSTDSAGIMTQSSRYLKSAVTISFCDSFDLSFSRKIDKSGQLPHLYGPLPHTILPEKIPMPISYRNPAALN